MSFGDAIKLGFSNYLNFSDRACRSEYWFWHLLVIIGLMASSLIDGWIAGSPIISRTFAPLVGTVFGLATILPGLSVSVRRLMIWIAAGGGYCWSWSR